MLLGPDDMLVLDEGGLLIPEHIPVEQKMSNTGKPDHCKQRQVISRNLAGKKYLAIKVHEEDEELPDNAPTVRYGKPDNRIN